MAKRIGEHLVAEGLVSIETLARVLQNQAKRGTDRIVSMLVGEGLITADMAARALSTFHEVPAALTRHIEGRDANLVGLLPAELAHEYQALPIAKTRDGALVVCMCDPHKQPLIDALASHTGLRIVASVACATVLGKALEAAYGPREDEFDVSLTTGNHEAPAAAREPEFTLAMLDDVGVTKDHAAQSAVPNANASTSQLLRAATPATTAAAPPPRPEPVLTSPITSLSGIIGNRPGTAPSPTEAPARPSAPISPMTTSPDGKVKLAARAQTQQGYADVSLRPPAAAATNSFVEKPLAAVASAFEQPTSRDEITSLCVEFLQSHWQSGLIFTLKDGLALGHRGFGGNANPAAIDALAIPTTSPSIIKQVFDTRQAVVSASSGVIQDRLTRLIGTETMIAAPITVGPRLVSIIVVGSPRKKATLNDLGSIAAAVGEGYARLLRAAKQG